jgi:hypothetical protein
VNEVWCGNDNSEKGMVRGSWKGGEWKGDGKGGEWNGDGKGIKIGDDDRKR